MIYANECDEKAAYWLSCLPLQFDSIDLRKIEEVQADDVREFTQCHFFAGIGGWPYALQLAQWPVEIPVWTGSCPCQPFSSAGKRKGSQDKERALWPEFRRLIAACHPPVIFGEQVASKLGRAWLAGVRADLEALGYAVGAADLCAAGVGAPHIRQRLFWVAYMHGAGQPQREMLGRIRGEETGEAAGKTVEPGCRLGDGTSQGSFSRSLTGIHRGKEGAGARHGEPERPSADGRMGNANANRQHETGQRVAATGCDGINRTGERMGNTDSEREGAVGGIPRRQRVERTGSDFWRRADYLYCTDQKYRPVEPGAFPLAHGVPGRVAQLRGLGNAIVAELAAGFIRSSVQAITDNQPAR